MTAVILLALALLGAVILCGAWYLTAKHGERWAAEQHRD